MSKQTQPSNPPNAAIIIDGMSLRPDTVAQLEGCIARVATARLAAVGKTKDLSSRLELPKLYSAQHRIVSESARFNVVNVGRRAGKTYLGVYLACAVAAQGYPVGWFSPTYKYILDCWPELVRILKPITARKNEQDRRLELKNGGSVEVWTLENEDAGRGRKYKLVIVDEAAMVSALKDKWDKAISPTLTDYAGDGWFFSTPQGLNGYFDLYQRGENKAEYPDWRCWTLPSSINPFLPKEEIERQRRELPELAFRQEYLAEFIQSDGAVFRNVDACLHAPVTTPEDHKGHLLVAGVDWGRQHDFTAISILCCQCRAEVALDRFNQIGWEFQRARLLNRIREWGVGYTLIEANSIGSPNLEALRNEAPAEWELAGFLTTVKSKPKLIQGLALCLERADLQWLPDVAARFELISYQCKITLHGHPQYAAPEGGFDDTVIARALARRAAARRMPLHLSVDEQIEMGLPEGWRVANAPDISAGWVYDGWALARDLAIKDVRKQVEKQYRGLDDPWKPASPVEQWAGVQREGW